MAELRHHRNGGSTSIPWSTSQDRHLSFIARGLLGYALSLPPGWAFSAERIANETPNEGKRAVLNGLKELEAAGYRRVVTERGSNGQLKTIVEFAFMPVTEWITEFKQKESTQAARKRPGPKPLTAGAKKAAQESANAAREAKLGKRAKPQVTPEVNQPDSGDTNSGQAGETDKTAGRTGSQPTGFRPVELLRSTPTETTTHTPAPAVPGASSGVEVDGVCVSIDEIKTVTNRVVETIPVSSRKWIGATGHAQLENVVRECLTMGYTPDVIVAEANTATREGTTHPVNLICKTLKALQTIDPATLVSPVAPGSIEAPGASSGACVSCGDRSDAGQFDAKGLCPECVANGYGMFFAEVGQ